MNLIKQYELHYIEQEELSERIHGIVNESLEADLGFDCLQFYVALANNYHGIPYFLYRKNNTEMER